MDEEENGKERNGRKRNVMEQKREINEAGVYDGTREWRV